MNIYPQDMRQILAYVEALNAADEKLLSDPAIKTPLTVDLRITVIEAGDGAVFGHIVDEIGGAWSFQVAS